MKKLSCFWIAAALSCLSIPGLSQHIDISLNKVIEVRTLDEYDSYLMLVFGLSGIRPEWKECVQVQRALAVDENDQTYDWLNGSFEDDYQQYQNFYLSLPLPPRTVKTLKRVEVSVQIFTPSEEHASVVRIKDFHNKLYRDLLDGQDDRSAFIPMDSTTLAQMDEEYWRTQPIDQLRAHLSTTQVSETAPSSQSAHFLILDPEERIQQISFYNGDGEQQMANGFGWSDMSRSFSFPDANIDEDWTLKLIIENQASTREYTFQLFDIVLP